ncbi:MAG: hybrid sensor histidine kinase/response regulator [candidate division WOR-3 bacterium]|nr:MAG: hybrid sensor histidine kinase/response regulator [candidate division WOR-3 bacterium]
MEKPKILVIDDEKAICDACAQILDGENYDVETTQNGESGLQKIGSFRPYVVFVDLKMPGLSGMEVLTRIREEDPKIVPVVITGFATVESAVQSMKVGAYDFLTKPFTPDQLRVVTKRALDWRKASLDAERLRNEKEKLRQNFISMVSHELRTPLVSVMQYLEVISGGFVGGISQEGTRIVERMKTRLDELLRLIDRWLKLARLEEVSFKDEYEDIEVSSIVREAVDTLEDMAAGKGVHVVFEPDLEECMTRADRELIREVFINLISNAVKYNREHGDVKIALRECEDYWIADVSDTGVGISEENIKRVGEEFYRVKSEGTVAGTGIGLAIVKKILDMHDGRLEVVSRLNEGSTFSVYLPKLNYSKRSKKNG